MTPTYPCLHRALVPASRYEVPPAIPVSYEGQYNPWPWKRTSQLSYSYAAAILLAIDHFNNRDASVVPELRDLDPDCTIHFPEPTFADSETSKDASVQALWNAMSPSDPHCAVLAPLQEDAVLRMMPALKALDIPLLVHAVENDWLARDEAGDGVAALFTLSAEGRARAMVEYLSHRQFLAHWYPASDPQEEALALAVERLSENLFDMQTFLFADQKPPVGVDPLAYRREQLEQLKLSGVTTIILVIQEPYELPSFADQLEELGMLTIDYVYILPPYLVPFDRRNNVLVNVYGELKRGSALDKLLAGSIVFDRLDGFDFRGESKDPFWRAWKRQTAEQVERLNALVPLPWLQANPDYFQTVEPSPGASFI